MVAKLNFALKTILISQLHYSLNLYSVLSLQFVSLVERFLIWQREKLINTHVVVA